MEASKFSPPLPKYLQLVDETKFMPQCWDLLPSTPLEPSWRSCSLHQYQGYWFSTMYLQALLVYRNHFEARGSDIFLVNLAEIGTTWLKGVVFVLVNRNRPYWENVLGHRKESLANPHEVMYLKHEDLKLVLACCKEIAGLLGYSFSPDEESSGVVDDIIKLRSHEKMDCYC